MRAREAREEDAVSSSRQIGVLSIGHE
jgi:hypothetical protein